jgi:UDP-N-acetylmuramoyl-L-alanyl-D-glutamate--2,6-diaminopimelate ligase
MSRYSISPITASALRVAIGDSALLSGADTTITGITQDSRSVSRGDVFCCVRGESFDGHRFALDAVSQGASALLVDSTVPGVPESVAVITVPDVREALGLFASVAFSIPARSLTMVGITGTNGKTSTASIIASILRADGKSVEVMGTLTNVRTTPEAIDLQAFLHDCVTRGVTHVVMEVSSHALDQHRVAGVMFDVAVFTNLSRDHLDYHKTFELYFAAKAKLFTPQQALLGVMNSDDPHGQLLLDVGSIPMVAFSQTDVSEVTIRVDSVSFRWKNNVIALPMGGGFTLMNALAAVTACDQLGVSVEAMIDGCADLGQIPGRFQSVPNDLGLSVVVDYAHTPDGLQQVITSARAVCTGRLIVVFGCGGDRDAGKRPLMGAAAQEADIVYVTSDNPRSEDPALIMKQVAVGISRESCEVHMEIDRAKAIASAISMAGRGDIVVIAGKGHEATQEVAGVHYPFNDVDVAKSALSHKKGSEL